MEDDIYSLSSESDDDSYACSVRRAYKNTNFKTILKRVREVIFLNNKNGNSIELLQAKLNDLFAELRTSLLRTSPISVKILIWKHLIIWLKAIRFSKFSVRDLRHDSNFNQMLIDIMALYIDSKCQYVRNAIDGNEMSESRIKQEINEILLLLNSLFENEISPILMVLLKVERDKNYSCVLYPLFQKYLGANYKYQSKEIISYLRLVFSFICWKKHVSLGVEKEEIIAIALKMLPRSVPKVTEETKKFFAIADVIRLAVKRKMDGTEILLRTKALDLDAALLRYFEQCKQFAKTKETHTVEDDKSECSFYSSSGRISIYSQANADSALAEQFKMLRTKKQQSTSSNATGRELQSKKNLMGSRGRSRAKINCDLGLREKIAKNSGIITDLSKNLVFKQTKSSSTNQSEIESIAIIDSSSESDGGDACSRSQETESVSSINKTITVPFRTKPKICTNNISNVTATDEIHNNGRNIKINQLNTNTLRRIPCKPSRTLETNGICEILSSDDDKPKIVSVNDKKFEKVRIPDLMKNPRSNQIRISTPTAVEKREPSISGLSSTTKERELPCSHGEVSSTTDHEVSLFPTTSIQTARSQGIHSSSILENAREVGTGVVKYARSSFRRRSEFVPNTYFDDLSSTDEELSGKDIRSPFWYHGKSSKLPKGMRRHLKSTKIKKNNPECVNSQYLLLRRSAHDRDRSTSISSDEENGEKKQIQSHRRLDSISGKSAELNRQHSSFWGILKQEQKNSDITSLKNNASSACSNVVRTESIAKQSSERLASADNTTNYLLSQKSETVELIRSVENETISSEIEKSLKLNEVPDALNITEFLSSEMLDEKTMVKDAGTMLNVSSPSEKITANEVKSVKENKVSEDIDMNSAPLNTRNLKGSLETPNVGPLCPQINPLTSAQTNSATVTSTNCSEDLIKWLEEVSIHLAENSSNSTEMKKEKKETTEPLLRTAELDDSCRILNLNYLEQSSVQTATKLDNSMPEASSTGIEKITDESKKGQLHTENQNICLIPADDDAVNNLVCGTKYMSLERMNSLPSEVLSQEDEGLKADALMVTSTKGSDIMCQSDMEKNAIEHKCVPVKNGSAENVVIACSSIVTETEIKENSTEIDHRKPTDGISSKFEDLTLLPNEVSMPIKDASEILAAKADMRNEKSCEKIGKKEISSINKFRKDTAKQDVEQCHIKKNIIMGTLQNALSKIARNTHFNKDNNSSKLADVLDSKLEPKFLYQQNDGSSTVVSKKSERTISSTKIDKLANRDTKKKKTEMKKRVNVSNIIRKDDSILPKDLRQKSYLTGNAGKSINNIAGAKFPTLLECKNSERVEKEIQSDVESPSKTSKSQKSGLTNNNKFRNSDFKSDISSTQVRVFGKVSQFSEADKTKAGKSAHRASSSERFDQYEWENSTKKLKEPRNSESESNSTDQKQELKISQKSVFPTSDDSNKRKSDRANKRNEKFRYLDDSRRNSLPENSEQTDAQSISNQCVIGSNRVLEEELAVCANATQSIIEFNYTEKEASPRSEIEKTKYIQENCVENQCLAVSYSETVLQEEPVACVNSIQSMIEFKSIENETSPISEMEKTKCIQENPEQTERNVEQIDAQSISNQCVAASYSETVLQEQPAPSVNSIQSIIEFESIENETSPISEMEKTKCIQENSEQTGENVEQIDAQSISNQCVAASYSETVLQEEPAASVNSIQSIIEFESIENKTSPISEMEKTKCIQENPEQTERNVEQIDAQSISNQCVAASYSETVLQEEPAASVNSIQSIIEFESIENETSPISELEKTKCIQENPEQTGRNGEKIDAQSISNQCVAASYSETVLQEQPAASVNSIQSIIEFESIENQTSPKSKIEKTKYIQENSEQTGKNVEQIDAQSISNQCVAASYSETVLQEEPAASVNSIQSIIEFESIENKTSPISEMEKTKCIQENPEQTERNVEQIDAQSISNQCVAASYSETVLQEEPAASLNSIQSIIEFESIENETSPISELEKTKCIQENPEEPWKNVEQIDAQSISNQCVAASYSETVLQEEPAASVNSIQSIIEFESIENQTSPKSKIEKTKYIQENSEQTGKNVEQIHAHSISNQCVAASYSETVLQEEPAASVNSMQSMIEFNSIEKETSLKSKIDKTEYIQENFEQTRHVEQIDAQCSTNQCLAKIDSETVLSENRDTSEDMHQSVIECNSIEKETCLKSKIEKNKTEQIAEEKEFQTTSLTQIDSLITKDLHTKVAKKFPENPLIAKLPPLSSLFAETTVSENIEKSQINAVSEILTCESLKETLVGKPVVETADNSTPVPWRFKRRLSENAARSLLADQSNISFDIKALCNSDLGPSLTNRVSDDLNSSSENEHQSENKNEKSLSFRGPGESNKLKSKYLNEFDKKISAPTIVPQDATVASVQRKSQRNRKNVKKQKTKTCICDSIPGDTAKTRKTKKPDSTEDHHCATRVLRSHSGSTEIHLTSEFTKPLKSALKVKKDDGKKDEKKTVRFFPGGDTKWGDKNSQETGKPIPTKGAKKEWLRKRISSPPPTTKLYGYMSDSDDLGRFVNDADSEKCNKTRPRNNVKIDVLQATDEDIHMENTKLAVRKLKSDRKDLLLSQKKVNSVQKSTKCNSADASRELEDRKLNNFMQPTENTDIWKTSLNSEKPNSDLEISIKESEMRSALIYEKMSSVIHGEIFPNRKLRSTDVPDTTVKNKSIADLPPYSPQTEVLKSDSNVYQEHKSVEIDHKNPAKDAQRKINLLSSREKITEQQISSKSDFCWEDSINTLETTESAVSRLFETSEANYEIKLRSERQSDRNSFENMGTNVELHNEIKGNEACSLHLPITPSILAENVADGTKILKNSSPTVIQTCSETSEIEKTHCLKREDGSALTDLFLDENLNNFQRDASRLSDKGITVSTDCENRITCISYLDSRCKAEMQPLGKQNSDMMEEQIEKNSCGQQFQTISSNSQLIANTIGILPSLNSLINVGSTSILNTPSNNTKPALKIGETVKRKKSVQRRAKNLDGNLKSTSRLCDKKKSACSGAQDDGVGKNKTKEIPIYSHKVKHITENSENKIISVKDIEDDFNVKDHSISENMPDVLQTAIILLQLKDQKESNTCDEQTTSTSCSPHVNKNLQQFLPHLLNLDHTKSTIQTLKSSEGIAVRAPKNSHVEAREADMLDSPLFQNALTTNLIPNEFASQTITKSCDANLFANALGLQPVVNFSKTSKSIPKNKTKSALKACEIVQAKSLIKDKKSTLRTFKDSDGNMRSHLPISDKKVSISIPADDDCVGKPGIKCEEVAFRNHKKSYTETSENNSSSKNQALPKRLSGMWQAPTVPTALKNKVDSDTSAVNTNTKVCYDNIIANAFGLLPASFYPEKKTSKTVQSKTVKSKKSKQQSVKNSDRVLRRALPLFEKKNDIGDPADPDNVNKSRNKSSKTTAHSRKISFVETSENIVASVNDVEHNYNGEEKQLSEKVSEVNQPSKHLKLREESDTKPNGDDPICNSVGLLPSLPFIDDAEDIAIIENDQNNSSVYTEDGGYTNLIFTDDDMLIEKEQKSKKARICKSVNHSRRKEGNKIKTPIIDTRMTAHFEKRVMVTSSVRDIANSSTSKIQTLSETGTLQSNITQIQLEDETVSEPCVQEANVESDKNIVFNSLLLLPSLPNMLTEESATIVKNTTEPELKTGGVLSNIEISSGAESNQVGAIENMTNENSAADLKTTQMENNKISIVSTKERVDYYDIGNDHPFLEMKSEKLHITSTVQPDDRTVSNTTESTETLSNDAKTRENDLLLSVANYGKRSDTVDTNIDIKRTQNQLKSNQIVKKQILKRKNSTASSVYDESVGDKNVGNSANECQTAAESCKIRLIETSHQVIRSFGDVDSRKNNQLLLFENISENAGTMQCQMKADISALLPDDSIIGNGLELPTSEYTKNAASVAKNICQPALKVSEIVKEKILKRQNSATNPEGELGSHLLVSDKNISFIHKVNHKRRKNSIALDQDSNFAGTDQTLPPYMANVSPTIVPVHLALQAEAQKSVAKIDPKSNCDKIKGNASNLTANLPIQGEKDRVTVSENLYLKTNVLKRKISTPDLIFEVKLSDWQSHELRLSDKTVGITSCSNEDRVSKLDTKFEEATAQSRKIQRIENSKNVNTSAIDVDKNYDAGQQSLSQNIPKKLQTRTVPVELKEQLKSETSVLKVKVNSNDPIRIMDRDLGTDKQTDILSRTTNRSISNKTVNSEQAYIVPVQLTHVNLQSKKIVEINRPSVYPVAIFAANEKRTGAVLRKKQFVRNETDICSSERGGEENSEFMQNKTEPPSMIRVEEEADNHSRKKITKIRNMELDNKQKQEPVGKDIECGMNSHQSSNINIQESLLNSCINAENLILSEQEKTMHAPTTIVTKLSEDKPAQGARNEQLSVILKSNETLQETKNDLLSSNAVTAENISEVLEKDNVLIENISEELEKQETEPNAIASNVVQKEKALTENQLCSAIAESQSSHEHAEPEFRMFDTINHITSDTSKCDLPDVLLATEGKIESDESSNNITLDLIESFHNAPYSRVSAKNPLNKNELSIHRLEALSSEDSIQLEASRKIKRLNPSRDMEKRETHDWPIVIKIIETYSNILHIQKFIDCPIVKALKTLPCEANIQTYFIINKIFVAFLYECISKKDYSKIVTRRMYLSVCSEWKRVQGSNIDEKILLEVEKKYGKLKDIVGFRNLPEIKALDGFITEFKETKQDMFTNSWIDTNRYTIQNYTRMRDSTPLEKEIIEEITIASESKKQEKESAKADLEYEGHDVTSDEQTSEHETKMVVAQIQDLNNDMSAVRIMSEHQSRLQPEDVLSDFTIESDAISADTEEKLATTLDYNIDQILFSSQWLLNDPIEGLQTEHNNINKMTEFNNKALLNLVDNDMVIDWNNYDAADSHTSLLTETSKYRDNFSHSGCENFAVKNNAPFDFDINDVTSVTHAELLLCTSSAEMSMNLDLSDYTADSFLASPDQAASKDKDKPAPRSRSLDKSKPSNTSTNCQNNSSFEISVKDLQEASTSKIELNSKLGGNSNVSENRSPTMSMPPSPIFAKPNPPSSISKNQISSKLQCKASRWWPSQSSPTPTDTKTENSMPKLSAEKHCQEISSTSDSSPTKSPTKANCNLTPFIQSTFRETEIIKEHKPKLDMPKLDCFDENIHSTTTDNPNILNPKASENMNIPYLPTSSYEEPILLYMDSSETFLEVEVETSSHTLLTAEDSPTSSKEIGSNAEQLNWSNVYNATSSVEHTPESERLSKSNRPLPTSTIQNSGPLKCPTQATTVPMTNSFLASNQRPLKNSVVINNKRRCPQQIQNQRHENPKQTTDEIFNRLKQEAPSSIYQNRSKITTAKNDFIKSAGAGVVILDTKSKINTFPQGKLLIPDQKKRNNPVNVYAREARQVNSSRIIVKAANATSYGRTESHSTNTNDLLYRNNRCERPLASAVPWDPTRAPNEEIIQYYYTRKANENKKS